MFTSNTAAETPVEESLTRMAMAMNLGESTGLGSCSPDTELDMIFENLPELKSLRNTINMHLSSVDSKQSVIQSLPPLEGNDGYDLRGGVKDARWYPDHVVPKFRESWIKEVISGFPGFLDKQTLCIIADPVTNQSEFHEPNLGWYLNALDHFFPHYGQMSILVVSSEPEWAWRHFGCLENVTVLEKDETSMCLASRCCNFIAKADWFSFWSIRIAQVQNRWINKMIMCSLVDQRPTDKVSANFHPTGVEPVGPWRCDLTDVSFIEAQPYYGMDSVIPLAVSFRFIEKHFKTSSTLAEAECKENAGFQILSIDWGLEELWHMRMNPDVFSLGIGLRYAAECSESEILCFWDGYHAVSPVAIWHAANMIRQGELDAVIPHNMECLWGSEDLWMRSDEAGVDCTRKLTECSEQFYAPMMVSRDAYEKIGGHKAMNTSAHTHKELFLRMAHSGMNVDIMPGSTLMAIGAHEGDVRATEDEVREDREIVSKIAPKRKSRFASKA